MLINPVECEVAVCHCIEVAIASTCMAERYFNHSFINTLPNHIISLSTTKIPLTFKHQLK